MAVKRKTESGKPGASEITAMDHFKTVLLGGLGIDAEGTQSDRSKYSKDPVGWVRDRLGEHLWTKQQEICESVRDNRLTAVRSAHSTGKSYLASRLAAWWIETHTPGEAFVVTTATTASQVAVVLWREIGRVHAKGNLSGRVTLNNKWYIPTRHGNEEVVALGIKPKDYDPTALHGIHCLDDQHEVLTRRGWINITQVKLTDEVLSPPLNEDVATWMPVTKIHKYRFKGELNRYDSRTVSFSATDEHRFPSRNQYKDTEWKLEPLSKWSERYVRRSSTWAGSSQKVPAPFKEFGWDMCKFAEFLGFWTGDGGIRQHSSGKFYEILIYQTKELETVRRILGGTPFRDRATLGEFAFSSLEGANWLLNNVGRYSPGRRVPQIILDSTPDVIEKYMDGFWAAEGSLREDGTRGSAYSTSKQLLDGIQELQTKIGCPASIGINRVPDGVARGAAVSPANHTCYTIGWDNNPAPHLVRNKNITRVPYDGFVWCLSTPNETFYVRRDGKVWLSGNSRYVLVILDEAAGIAESLWTAADSLASGSDCRMLAIGNPDFPVGEFVECFSPRSSWNKIHISAFDTPNFTGEEVPDELRHVLASKVWQEEKLLKWGQDNPLYQSKVLGEFPIVNENGLIPVTWIEAARNRTLEPVGQSVLGVDVGGGTDKSVIAHRVGPVVRIKREWSTSNPDTMQTLGMLMQVLKDTDAEVAHVDAVGIGQGIVDRAFDISTDQREKSKSDKSRKVRAGKIKGVKVGSSPRDSETYMNLRAEAYWGLRERFQDGAIDLDPDDEDLAAELADLRFKRTSRGQIQIESKDDMRRRGKPSPDRADAVMLAFCDPNIVRKKTKATWGKGLKDRAPGSVITNIARARAPRPGRSGRR